MKEIIYMAWRYLRYYWAKSSILIVSISLILFLPSGLRVLVNQSADMLKIRAESTPLLIGAKGSSIDLTLSALYFKAPHTEPIPFQEVSRLSQTELGRGIPLHLRYVADEQRIVGTTMEYIKYRGLTLERGRWMAFLGECVVGSEAAKKLDVDVGDYVFSSPGSAFDVSGSFPLKMMVTGILEPSGSEDDGIVLVDVKTTWVIAGLAHGHENVNTTEENDARIVQRTDSNVVANSSLLLHTEITPENISTFHFHGDSNNFPIDAVIVVPQNFKASVLLRGRYGEDETQVQMIVPSEVVEGLIETMFSIRDWIIIGSLLVGVGTIMTVFLVFNLSIRLRRREIGTIHMIGGGHRRMNLILAAEIIFVCATAAGLSGLLTLLVSRFGGVAVRMISGGAL